MTKTARLTCSPILACLAACASSPPADFDAVSIDALHAFERRAIPASLAVDVTDEPVAAIRVGDSAVYSLRLHTPTTEKSWFVRTTVAAHRSESKGSGNVTLEDGRRIDVVFTGAVRFHLQVTDSTGRPIDASFTDPVSTEVLREGFVRACEFCSSLQGLAESEFQNRVMELPLEARRPVVVSILSMTTLLTLVLNSEPLAPLIEEAVRRPSLLSIARNFGDGIGVNFEFRKARSWPGETPIPAQSAHVFPLDVQAYGERALEASMVVARPESSTSVGAGIMSIAGVHPDNREVWVQMQLQAVGRLGKDELARVTHAEETAPVSERYR